MAEKKINYSMQIWSSILQKNSVLIVSAALFISCVISPVLAVGDTNDFLISLKEKQSLETFRNSVKDSLPEDFMKTDLYLIRWLRVANLDIPTAKRLLMKTVEWRVRNNISQILSEDFSDISEDFPINHGGYDKDGRPVTELNINEWDLRSAALQGKQHRLQRYLEYANEKTFQAVLHAQQETGKPIARAVFIVDGDGVNFRQHICPICLPSIMQWTTSTDTHYPFIIAETIIINAPPIMSVGLNAVRPLMSADMRNRIRVFDTNKQRWANYLDQRIDKSQRSRRFAGTKTL